VNAVDTKVLKTLLMILESKYPTQFTRPYYKRNNIIHLIHFIINLEHKIENEVKP
jgi:hypothetical protein